MDAMQKNEPHPHSWSALTFVDGNGYTLCIYEASPEGDVYVYVQNRSNSS
ncbi:hypothetical protein Krac_9292 [Ktedonobacter racemifer DSM 44963]|uniref:Uncharacterized protein n=1 Tax=Ktedonobacter racemifer DSM 44963 TaxID=485913 RepID=D6TBE8_KTERA|nr:hypothetical protein Krac_9292 [Ktedonobacter racemifer DSM 44963]